MHTADLQFHIIYTPDTVVHLTPFVLSLLEFSDCRYQLVSNGCLPPEADLLEEFCAGDPRLSFRKLATTEMLDHGSALDTLQADCRDEWFCFMDSDILAVAPFSELLGRYIDDCDVFSSGHPLWHAPEDIFLPPHFRRWQGSYCAATDGTTLGFTYFALYRNAALSQVRQETGIGFGYRYWDTVPAAQQSVLKQSRLDKIDYDTGKLLMALMHIAGFRLRAAELDALLHLGGVSALAGEPPDYYYRGRLDRLACTLLSGALARPLFYLADLRLGLRSASPGLTREQSAMLTAGERRVMQSRRRKRINTARYFTALLLSLQRAAPTPDLPKLGYGPAEQRIADATEHVRRQFAARPPKTLQAAVTG
ncbi:MAG: hypothetical protein V2J12_09220 [Gammaproteobacteria bacterium]|jgi:hypothetical protein|nr:hypothetical protein [Gammaproteobacteria bacterium]